MLSLWQFVQTRKVKLCISAPKMIPIGVSCRTQQYTHTVQETTLESQQVSDNLQIGHCSHYLNKPAFCNVGYHHFMCPCSHSVHYTLTHKTATIAQSTGSGILLASHTHNSLWYSACQSHSQHSLWYSACQSHSQHNLWYSACQSHSQHSLWHSSCQSHPCYCL